MTDRVKRNALMKHREDVHCPGCGKRIREDEDMSKIEYVKTKRKTELFIHTGCFGKVWKHN